jgi:hypothetical protein
LLTQGKKGLRYLKPKWIVFPNIGNHYQRTRKGCVVRKAPRDYNATEYPTFQERIQFDEPSTKTGRWMASLVTQGISMQASPE